MQPFVQDQQIHLGIGLRHLLEQVVRTGNHKLVQQLRHAHIPNLLKLRAGGITQRAGKVGLPAAGGSLEDDVVASIYIGTRCQAEQLLLVQPAVRDVLNALHTGGGDIQPGVADTPVELVVLAAVPFGIHHESEALLKAKLGIGLGLLELLLKGGGHRAELHGAELFNRRSIKHCVYLPCCSSWLHG